MAHFAEINADNIVLQVLVVDDTDAERGQEFLADDLQLGGTWIQTSFNTQGGQHLKGGTPLRKNFAGIGYLYDPIRDAFIPPQPFASWTLNEETCQWNAPTPYPSDGASTDLPEGIIYTWNENAQTWDPVPSF